MGAKKEGGYRMGGSVKHYARRRLFVSHVEPIVKVVPFNTEPDHTRTLTTYVLLELRQTNVLYPWNFTSGDHWCFRWPNNLQYGILAFAHVCNIITYRLIPLEGWKIRWMLLGKFDQIWALNFLPVPAWTSLGREAWVCWRCSPLPELQFEQSPGDSCQVEAKALLLSPPKSSASPDSMSTSLVPAFSLNLKFRFGSTQQINMCGQIACYMRSGRGGRWALELIPRQ